MQSKTLSPTLRKVLIDAGPYISAGMWTLIVWLITMDVVEMGVTEWRYIYNAIPGSWRTWSLIIFFVFVTFLLTLWQQRKKEFSLKFLGITSAIFLGILLIHNSYSLFYQRLQRYPKLRSISKMSSIQAERIEIIGRNFGHPGKQGTVKVGGLEFLIITWNNERVVAEQPVPSRYFVDDMILTNQYGNTLVIENFAIKDPSELWE